MSGFDLRRAHGNDASILAALHALRFEVAWDAASLSRLLARAGASALLAVDCGGDTDAGFVLFEQAVDEGELLTIGIHPQFRGRGGARFGPTAGRLWALPRGGTCGGTHF